MNQFLQTKDSNTSIHSTLFQKEKKEKRKYLSCEQPQHEEQRVHARYIHTNFSGNINYPYKFICQACYDKNPDYYKQYAVYIENLLNIDKEEFAIPNWPGEQILEEPINFIREKEREREHIHQVERLFEKLKQNIILELDEAKNHIIGILKEEHDNTVEIIQELKNKIRSTFDLHFLKQKMEEVNRTKSKHYHHHHSNKDKNTTLKNNSRLNTSQNVSLTNINSPQVKLKTINENEVPNQLKESQNHNPENKLKSQYYGNKTYQLHDKLKDEIQDILQKQRYNKIMEIVEYYHKNLVKTKKHNILKDNFQDKAKEILKGIQWIKSSMLPVIPRITFQANDHNDSKSRVFVEGNIVRIKTKCKGTVIMTDKFHRNDKLTFSVKINKGIQQSSCWYIGVVSDQDASQNYCWFPSGNQICLHCKDKKITNSKHKFKIEGQTLPELAYEGIQIFCEILVKDNIFKFKILKQNDKEFKQSLLQNQNDNNQQNQNDSEQVYNQQIQSNNINDNQNNNRQGKTKSQLQQEREQYDKVEYQSEYISEYDFSQDFQYEKELEQWRLIFQSSYDLSLEVTKLEKIPSTFEHL